MGRTYGPYDRYGIRRTLLICDLFCGAGGFTTGATRALREFGLQAVMTAVNHWPVAIATHHLNHPHVRHYIEDVRAANPIEVVPERYLDVLLCSPSCVFFSRARGGRPVSDQKRMDPEAILRWIEEIDVRVLICENVPEFRHWCRTDPLTGRPVKGREGEYFRRWIRKIERRGYRVEWRILTCADYGDATTRQRWFMIARKDDEEILWPPQTHSRDGRADATGHPIPRWRGAEEIIDWSDRGTSIFGRRPRRKGYRSKPGDSRLRALAYNTLRRVKAGTDRFTAGWRFVFAAAIEEEMEMVRLDEAGIERPPRALLTFCWSGGAAHRVATTEARVVFRPGELVHRPEAGDILTGAASSYPVHGPVPSAGSPYTCANRTGNAPRAVSAPLPRALTGAGGGLWMAEPRVLPYVLSQQSGGAPRITAKPIPAIATAGAIALAVPDVSLPIGAARLRMHGRDVPASIHAGSSEPPRTPEGYTTSFYGGNVGQPCSASTLSLPLGAVTTRSRFGFCWPSITPYLVPQFGERPGQAPRLHPIDRPTPAVTSHGAGALVVPLLVRFDNAGAGGGCVRGASDPIWTITGKAGCALAESYIISPRHSRPGGGPAPRLTRLPVPTLTGGGSQVGVVSARAAEARSSHLEGSLGSEALELPLARAATPESAHRGGRIVWVDGMLILIDVTFRMLRNRELARSHSFDDEESCYEFVGTEAEQTRQVGNSVPVMTAQALVMSQIRSIPGVVAMPEHHRGTARISTPPYQLAT